MHPISHLLSSEDMYKILCIKQYNANNYLYLKLTSPLSITDRYILPKYNLNDIKLDVLYECTCNYKVIGVLIFLQDGG